MKENTSYLSKFLRNPDVVLREEDEDGGLLFNPDTNQIKVLNPTGLFVWNLCNGNNTASVMVEEMGKVFAEVPEEKVGKEIDNFLKEMVASGFVGIVEEKMD